MSELRYRPPETAPAPDRPQPPGSPHERDRQVTGRAATDTRHAPSDIPRYDADAQSKHPVPKPDGYLPDDIGGTARAPVALADRGYLLRRDQTETPRRPESVDRDRADASQTVEHPDFYVPHDIRAPNYYADAFTRLDGTRTPCTDGPPRREDTRQGWAGDCGIIAALGAVAGHRPDDITRRIRPNEDGTYQVTFSEARQNGGVTEPTGRDIEFTVTPEVPVCDDDPGTPACAKVQDGTAWCAIMEKAFAGADQTWTPEQWTAWENDWAAICAQDEANNVKNPRSGPAPTGYARLHQGTTPWERAEALTQLTGQPAVVREFPSGRDEWTINRVIRAQLADGKPVLVDSRKKTHEGERMPHRLEANHVYEVTGVENGKILLRNPWNYRHPEPMETEEFARNMNPYYSTLM